MTENSQLSKPSLVNSAKFFKIFHLHSFTAKPLPSPSSLGCFPSRTKIELKDGRQITMAELQLGQEVKTLDSEGAVKFSEVIAFLHKVPTGSYRFLRFDLEGGLQVTLTSEHLIYVTPQKSMARQVMFARDVKIGDKFVASGGAMTSVLKITTVGDVGLYAPLTADGNLFADGVLASCYAHVRSHELGHLTMAPIRALWHALAIAEDIFFAVPSLDNILGSNAWENAVNFYANALLAFTNYLPFKDSILSIASGI